MWRGFMTIFHELWGRKWACTAALALALGLVCTATSACGQERTVADTKIAPAAGSHALGQDERIRTIEATAVDIPMGEEEPPPRLSAAATDVAHGRIDGAWISGI